MFYVYIYMNIRCPFRVAISGYVTYLCGLFNAKSILVEEYIAGGIRRLISFQIVLVRK